MFDPRTAFQTKAISISEIKTHSINDSSMAPYMLVIAQSIKSLYSNFEPATTVGAACFEYSGYFSEALELYKKSIALKPNYENYVGIIRMQDYVNGPKEALMYADTALELYPNVGELYALASKIALKGMLYAQAIRYASNGISFSADPNTKILLLNSMIKSYLFEGDLSSAKRECDKALESFPNNPILLESMGDISAAKGNKNEAITFWKKALDNGGNTEILNNKIK
ncbi:MAG: hypothetical protein IT245_04920 [Bacteroidia bacterium]|nr:hypothetical protein [Bacteroidia bacterium]